MICDYKTSSLYKEMWSECTINEYVRNVPRQNLKTIQ